MADTHKLVHGRAKHLVGDHDGTGDGENTTNTCPGIGLKFWGRSGSLGGRALPVHKMGRNKRMRQGPQATSIGDVLISPLDGVRQRSARDNQDWQPPHAHRRGSEEYKMAMATLSVRSSVLRRPRDHPGVRGDLRSDRRQPRHLHWPAPLAPARPRLHGTNIRRYPAPSTRWTENIWFGRSWQQVLSFDIHFMQSLRTTERHLKAPRTS